MNESIHRRLQALEAKLAPAPKPVTFWIHFDCPGAPRQPAVRIRHVDQGWHRLDRETEGAFKKRVEAQAVLQPGYTGLVMLVDYGECSHSTRTGPPTGEIDNSKAASGGAPSSHEILSLG